MRIIFIAIVLLHGLLHLLGFIKAFGLSDVKELVLPISKPLGIVWMATTALFLIYGTLYFFNHSYSWVIGLFAVVLSQFLIITFWSDAKYGSLPNLIILVVILFSYGTAMFEALVKKEKTEILSQSENHIEEIFTETAIEDLPPPVKKWLLNSGAVGRAMTLNGKIYQKALMKMKPEQDEWNTATAVQYTVISEPSLLWAVELKMNGVMWFRGRDKFQDGKGEMLIKMNSLINVVNERGKKIDEGSIQRFLGEMVWFPSLAVSPYVRWEEIDAYSAKATMSYKNTQGSGTFYFDEKGDFIKFMALRFQGNEPGDSRKEWILTVSDYDVFGGIRVPSKMEATWRLETGDWTWLKLEIEEIEYNINAGH